MTIENDANVPAFFLRAEIVDSSDGDEILPITWSDNYVTVFEGESVTLEARYRTPQVEGKGLLVRIAGHNVAPITENLGAKAAERR